ncbi:hypothetical protein EUX98_g9113 [Antrodiella citrinella]|uniref:Uncharacterized protein n=1 Tax=Antrodiella citrinella TaxID=2447956 RepID=A0A4S4LXY7_9APHY|nr:hypothetical protein EUX98_g9113 [Antrodiella citrinella]
MLYFALYTLAFKFDHRLPHHAFIRVAQALFLVAYVVPSVFAMPSAADSTFASDCPNRQLLSQE